MIFFERGEELTLGIHQIYPARVDLVAAPRSLGTLMLSSKRLGAATKIDRFRTSGATKVAFPRSAGPLEAVIVNTSGGLTGGDEFVSRACAGQGSQLTLTTQAAERAYRSDDGFARVSTFLTVECGATLHWLPQELILFDGAALDRELTADVASDAEFLMVEPLIVGRMAMGEVVSQARFRDTVCIRRDGQPVYMDRVNLEGPVDRHLRRAAIANGAHAMASVVYVGPRAEALLSAVKPLLPSTGGASLRSNGLLVMRLLASDGFLLRQSLVPILKTMTKTELPKSWSL